MRTFVLSAALAAALLSGCKRDQPSGMPPATDWQQAEGQGGVVMPPKDPTDKAHPGNQQLGGNPHGGMGGRPPGAPSGPMPNDDIHSGMAQQGGGDGVPPNHPDMSGGGHGGDKSQMSGTEDTGPRALDKQADGRYVLGPFAIAVPAEWKAVPVTKGMRAAQFSLAPQTDLIVYFQGEMGMGSVKDNLDRWTGQVKGGKPTVEQVKFAGQDAHYLVVTGDYENTTPGMEKADKGQTFVGVILNSPQGPYYFKLVGPKSTIDPQLPKIRAMFDSMKLKS